MYNTTCKVEPEIAQTTIKNKSGVELWQKLKRKTFFFHLRQNKKHINMKNKNTNSK